MADLALVGLAEGTQTDAGALLLLPANVQGQPRGEDLELIASRSSSPHYYHRVSNFLASTVMREGEAVLARNVLDDSALGTRDSRGDILATGVICAPVRHGNQVFGLIHLYSTDAAVLPDPDDLEFTLAVADTVAVAVENIRRRQELTDNLTRVRTENVELRERLGIRSEIIGRSAAVHRMTEEMAQAAASNATVLIRGESGVGKELVARGVHANGPRRENVFVCLNCATLSAELLASELFGHERGAFTGATERKIGKFEAAHKGTLMLDEIGEMSPGIQAKFLRVLEGHSFERVGGSKPIKVDVRVIAATNRDLERDVTEGHFRRDLYFRLRVLEIVVPALRKRQEDIPLLADYFLEKFNAETGRKIQRFHRRGQRSVVEVPVAGQCPGVEERDRAGGGPLPQPGNRQRRPPADQSGHGGRHRAARPDRRPVRARLAGGRQAPPHLRHAHAYRLEQEPDGQHPGNRAFHAGPQNPPLPIGRSPAIALNRRLLRLRLAMTPGRPTGGRETRVSGMHHATSLAWVPINIVVLDCYNPLLSSSIRIGDGSCTKLKRRTAWRRIPIGRGRSQVFFRWHSLWQWRPHNFAPKGPGGPKTPAAA